VYDYVSRSYAPEEEYSLKVTVLWQGIKSILLSGFFGLIIFLMATNSDIEPLILRVYFAAMVLLIPCVGFYSVKLEKHRIEEYFAGTFTPTAVSATAQASGVSFGVLGMFLARFFLSTFNIPMMAVEITTWVVCGLVFLFLVFITCIHFYRFRMIDGF